MGLPKRTETEKHLVPTRDGWTLVAYRALRPGPAGSHPVDGPPVVIVPGYGMNSFIFGYHPTGRSFLEALSDAGLDAWRVDLRGQGETRRGDASRFWGLAEHAFYDIPAVFDYISTLTGRSRLDAIGCSLGGSLLYAYAGRYQGGRLDHLVAMGSPLWFERPTLPVAMVGLFGGAIANVPFRGTRQIARRALPWIAQNAPDALSIYMNAKLVDISAADRLCEVVEDPRVGVNRDVVRWIRRGRMVVDGLDIADALRTVTLPTLVVVAEGDGISNPDSCRSITRAFDPAQVDELTVGGPDEHIAHADLFVSAISDEKVFQPVARWLTTGSLEE